MTPEYEKMSDDERAAYDEAVRRIEEVRASGKTILDLEGGPDSLLRHLSVLPPQITALTQLTDLDFSDTKVIDITAVSKLTGLKALEFNNTAVSDISPLRGLSELEKLLFYGTRVSDISALSGMLGLKTLFISDNPVSNIAPLRNLKELQALYLDRIPAEDLSVIMDLKEIIRLSLTGTSVTDLRPLLQKHAKLHLLYFDQTPFAAATVKLREIAQLGENDEPEECAQQTITYLKTLPPWPEPLPWEAEQKTSDSEDAPEAPETPSFPILRLTSDHRIDLPQLGAPAGIDPAHLSRLYERLRRAVEQLSRYSNQYDGLSFIVASMDKSLGPDLESIDYVNLHLDFGELFDLRHAEENSNNSWDNGARAAADAVLRTGPALTVAHPEVEQHEKSISIFHRRATQSASNAEQKLMEDVGQNSAIATESTRAFGKRLVVSTTDGRVAEMRQAFSRKVILMLSTIGTGLTDAAHGAIYGEALKAIFPAAEFLWLHSTEVMAITREWSPEAARWAEYVLTNARVIVERAKDDNKEQ